MSEHVDVLIVGAGLSGIGAAHHIQAAPTATCSRPSAMGAPPWLPIESLPSLNEACY